MALLSDKFCLFSEYDEEMHSASVCSDGEWEMEGEEGARARFGGKGRGNL